MRRLFVVEEHGAGADLGFPDPVAMSRRSGEVVVAVRRRQPATEDVSTDTGVRWIALDGRRNPRTLVRELRRAPMSTFRLARACAASAETRDAPVAATVRHLPFADVAADVVHFASIDLAAAYPVLGSWLDAPVVVTCGGAELERLEVMGRAAAERAIRVLASAAAIHCPSTGVADRVLAMTGRAQRVWVDGAVAPDLGPSHSSSEHGTPIRVTTTAPLTVEARLEPVLVALAALGVDGGDARFRIVGDGPLERALRWTIDDLGLGAVVELITGATDDDRRALLSESDVYVATGRRAADGDLTRAMAMGVPVVVDAGDDVGVPIRDGLEGIVLHDPDVRALADALGRLLRDAELRGRLGANARELVARELSADANAARFDERYRVLLEKHRGGAASPQPLGAAASLRVGRYARTFPKKPDLVRQALALLDLGVDLEIFAGSLSPYASRFPELLGRDDLAGRVHYFAAGRSSAWSGTTRWQELRRVASHRTELVRFVAHNWRVRRTNGMGFWRGTWSRLAVVGRPIDVLHVESDTWAFEVADLAEFLDCPVLLSSLATLQRTSVGTRGPGAYAQLFGLADGYHFVSEYVRANTAALGLAGVPTWVEPSGIDTGLYAPPSQGRTRRAAAPLRLLSVGRLSWEKGYEWALEAVARARGEGVGLVYTIVGGGAEMDAIERRVRRLGLDDVVRLLGNVGLGEIIAEYHRADLLLHAAVDEAFPIAVLEAQATGLPIVCTDAGGLPEAVRDGVTGFVVPRRDPTALATKIGLLAADPARRAEMGAAARAHVVERFDVRRNARRMAEIYAEVAATRHPSTPRCARADSDGRDQPQG